jgi:hypothetical protein
MLLETAAIITAGAIIMFAIALWQQRRHKH